MQQATVEAGRRRRRTGAVRADRERRHEQAVIEAEVRRLMSAIGPFGTPRRDALARAAGAERRPAGVGPAPRSGRVRPLAVRAVELVDRELAQLQQLAGGLS